jgi:hypothetical protein
MNLVWFNRAKLYFNKCPTAGKFCGEFVFILRELRLVTPYNSNLNKKSLNT